MLTPAQIAELREKYDGDISSGRWGTAASYVGHIQMLLDEVEKLRAIIRTERAVAKVNARRAWLGSNQPKCDKCVTAIEFWNHLRTSHSKP